MKIKIFTVLLFISLVACDGNYVAPTYHYEAKFDISLVNEVEKFMVSTAGRWKLKLHEKDKEEMKFLTQGKEAFFITLYYKDETVLIITNSGGGDILVLSLFDYGELPLVELKKLAAEVRGALKKQFNIELL